MHVSDKSYLVFHVIQQEVRSYLRISNVRAVSAGTQAKMVGNVVTSENMQFYWCMVAYVRHDGRTCSRVAKNSHRVVDHCSRRLLCEIIHGAVQTANQKGSSEVQSAEKET